MPTIIIDPTTIIPEEVSEDYRGQVSFIPIHSVIPPYEETYDSVWVQIDPDDTSPQEVELEALVPYQVLISGGRVDRYRVTIVPPSEDPIPYGDLVKVRPASTQHPDILEAVLTATIKVLGNHSGSSGDVSVAWSDVTGKPATYTPTIGEGPNQAKAGDWTPSWDEVEDKPTTFAPTVGTGPTDAKPGDWEPSWTAVTGKPSTFPPVVGTGPSDAKAGNWVPSWSEVGDKPSTFPPTVGTSADQAKAGNWVPAWGDITGKPSIPSSPSVGTAAQLQAGTDTVDRVWSAQVIADEIDRRVAEAIAAIEPAE